MCTGTFAPAAVRVLEPLPAVAVHALPPLARKVPFRAAPVATLPLATVPLATVRLATF